MMQTFRANISKNVKLLISVRLRNKLSLKAGKSVLIKEVENGILITSIDESIKQAQAIVNQLTQGQSLTGELKKLQATDYDLWYLTRRFSSYSTIKSRTWS